MVLAIAGLGLGELVVIFLIILVVFGAGKLPQIGDALGKTIRNFKKSAAGDDEIDVTPQKSAGLPPPQARESAPHAEESRKV